MLFGAARRAGDSLMVVVEAYEILVLFRMVELGDRHDCELMIDSVEIRNYCCSEAACVVNPRDIENRRRVRCGGGGSVRAGQTRTRGMRGAGNGSHTRGEAAPIPHSPSASCQQCGMLEFSFYTES